MVFAGSLTEKPLAIAFPILLTPSKVQKVLFPSCFNPLFLRPPNPAASFSSRLNSSESLPDPDLQSVMTSSAPASLQAWADSRERFRRVIEMERKEVNWQSYYGFWFSVDLPLLTRTLGLTFLIVAVIQIFPFTLERNTFQSTGGGGSTSSDPSYEFLA